MIEAIQGAEAAACSEPFQLIVEISAVQWSLWHPVLVEGLARRLAAVESADDANDLGYELVAAGDQLSAQQCFERAVQLDASHSDAWSNLAHTFADGGDLPAALDAWETAAWLGDSGAWFNVGVALERLGDLAGSVRAYEHSHDAGCVDGTFELGWFHQRMGDHEAAIRQMEDAASRGHLGAAGVLAHWRWIETLDPALEHDLRAGADHYPSARVTLAQLLRAAGRIDEARDTLERGAKLGEDVCFLPLGVLYADDLGDPAAAEDAYRQGIAAGDNNSHCNLGVLLEQQDRLDEAQEQYRMGADGGDALAARHLDELLDDA